MKVNSKTAKVNGKAVHLYF
ncbi:hypothetical protein [Paenibacillus sp. ACRRY]|nr:hypothetical protein [Paenibacillus sp. ACRRY]MCG7381615.1 hypothetical protein [Paenibacillus sp. ACRRY]